MELSTDAHHLLSARSDPPEPPPSRRFAASVLVAALIAATFAIWLVDRDRTQAREGALAVSGARVEAAAEARAVAARAWLDDVTRAAEMAAGRTDVGIFARNAARLGEPDDGADGLASAVRSALRSVLDSPGHLGATLIGPDGRPLLSVVADGARGPVPGVTRELWPVVPGEGRVVLPLRIASAGGAGSIAGPPPVAGIVPASGESGSVARPGEALGRAVIDVVVPLPPLGDLPVAASLALTVASDGLLRYVGERAGDGTRLHLLQRNGISTLELETADGPVLQPGPRELAGLLDGPIGATSIAAAGGGRRLVAAAPVDGSGLVVLASFDEAQIEAAAGAIGQPLVLALLIVVGVAALVAVLSAWQRGSWCEDWRHRVSALDQRMSDLRGLFTTLAEIGGGLVAVRATDDRLAYANQGFADGIGRSAGDLIGRVDRDVLPPSIVRALAEAEPRLRDGTAGVPVQVTLPATGTTVELRTHAMRQSQGRVFGFLVVGREPAAHEVAPRSDDLLAQNTIEALVRAVELRDPFLFGHSQRVEQFALGVGRELDLDPDELATLQITARLSQIGKIFIPDALLTKPGRHNRREMRIMRSHLKHALKVLEPIPFELPVKEALAQMYERLDGSGYPHGLKGAEIGRVARILAVVDVFCARTAPRSYRDQVTPGHALYYLAQHPERYDVQAISALAQLVAGGQPALPPPTIELDEADQAA